MKKLLLISLIVFLIGILFYDNSTAALSTDLSGVIVYPNPFDPNEGHTEIIFENLTDNAKIRIYKLTGEMIFENNASTVNGRATWNVKTSANDDVSYGTYIYLITNDKGQNRSGKMGIKK